MRSNGNETMTPDMGQSEVLICLPRSTHLGSERAGEEYGWCIFTSGGAHILGPAASMLASTAQSSAIQTFPIRPGSALGNSAHSEDRRQFYTIHRMVN